MGLLDSSRSDGKHAEESRGLRQCPVCKEFSLRWNPSIGLHECSNFRCRLNFTEDELAARRGQQLQTEQSKDVGVIKQSSQRRPEKQTTHNATIKFTWGEAQPYPPIIHNKYGEKVVELLPSSFLKSALLGGIGIHRSYPNAIEKWVWLNSYYIAVIVRNAWGLGVIENSSDAVNKFLYELEAKSGGTICFSCKKATVYPKGLFRRVTGFSCKTKNCVLHNYEIPISLLKRLDEMPDYSSEPEYSLLRELIDSLKIKLVQFQLDNIK